MLILKELPIGFFFECYLPALEKYIYHINYVHILSKHICGNMRNEACLSVPEKSYLSKIMLKDYLRILI